MTNQEDRSKAAADLRQKAEVLARERAALNPEDIVDFSNEEIRKILHELRVHQVEMEMQNEELRSAQAEIEAERARYFDLYDLAPVGYCTLSEKSLILRANLTVATLLGTTRSTLVKQPLSRFIHKDDQDIYYLHRKKLFETGELQEYELRLTKPDGALIWTHLTGTVAQADDGTQVCRLALTDITERKQAEDQLRALVVTDPLTKLFNRRGLTIATEQELRHVKRLGGMITIMFMDMNGMKRINDTYGHDMGDTVLVSVAQVMSETFRESDIIGRLGGDEFVVVALDATMDTVQPMITRLRESLKNCDYPFDVSLACGAVEYSQEKDLTLAQLLKQADSEMYKDKRQD